MDGNTPIDCFEPQFTQREAALVSNTETKTINNWVDRGFITLTKIADRRLEGRRLFSICDIIEIAVMTVCSKNFLLPPSGSFMLAHLVKVAFIENQDRPKSDQTGKYLEMWAACRVNPVLPSIKGNDENEDITRWAIKICYRDKETSVFMNRDGKVFTPSNSEPFLMLPVSNITGNVFLKCADLLLQGGVSPSHR